MNSRPTPPVRQQIRLGAVALLAMAAAGCSTDSSAGPEGPLECGDEIERVIVDGSLTYCVLSPSQATADLGCPAGTLSRIEIEDAVVCSTRREAEDSLPKRVRDAVDRLTAAGSFADAGGADVLLTDSGPDTAVPHDGGCADDSAPDNAERPWREVTSSAEFPPRFGHVSVVLDDRMWILGGYGEQGEPINDVWSSADGESWQLEVPRAPWSPRDGSAAVVFRDRLWLVDGVRQADVWSSADGVTWQQETPRADFPGRYGHQLLVYKDMMWLLGGYGTEGEPLNDVWSSSDGIAWQQQTAAASWSPRDGHAALVFDDRMWIIDGDRTGDVWTSTDGRDWQQLPRIHGFTPRSGHAARVFDGEIWILGGEGQDGELVNDVWRSADGISWTQAGPAPWSPRSLLGSLVFQDKLWVIDGVRSADVWALQ